MLQPYAGRFEVLNTAQAVKWLHWSERDNFSVHEMLCGLGRGENFSFWKSQENFILSKSSRPNLQPSQLPVQ
jgi:hypothetical protein